MCTHVYMYVLHVYSMHLYGVPNAFLQMRENMHATFKYREKKNTQ